MSYQKKHLSSKQFFIDYNDKLSNTLKKEHFVELEKITRTLEKKINTLIRAESLKKILNKIKKY